MRRLSYLLVMLFVFTACTREESFSEWDGPLLEMLVGCDDSPETRADEAETAPGDRAYHESQIDWVDFFFYPDGNTSASAAFHKRIEESAWLTKTYRLELTTQQVDYLIFPRPSTIQATVFALVNGPKEELDELLQQDNTSLPAIQSLVLNADFVSPANHRQDRFVMSGQTTITLEGRNRKLISRGRIDVKRFASKITVGIKADDYVELDTGREDEETHLPIKEHWTPCFEEMRIYLVDGVSNVNLSGTPAGLEGGVDTPEFFSYQSNSMYFFEAHGTDANRTYEQIFDKSADGYFNTYPMYTYPRYWETGKDSGNTREPYLKLILPWEREGDEEHLISYAKKEFYYRILLPNDNYFLRNNWYHYDVNVGMLGADIEDAAVEMNPIAFYINYWQDKNVVVKHANIGNARYLAVDKTKYELHNQTEVAMRYTTSHPVNFEVVSVTRPYYGKSTSAASINGVPLRKVGAPDPQGIYAETDKLYGEGTYYLIYGEEQYSGWFTDNGSAIVFNHSLNNDVSSSTFDYSPYKAIISITHVDNPKYTQRDTVVQYPAMYIFAEQNSDPNLGEYNDEAENSIKDKNPWLNYKHLGYVLIDGKCRSRKAQDGGLGQFDLTEKELKTKGYGSWTEGGNTATNQALRWLQWRTVNFTGGNRNIYNITVTVLPEGSNYVIGDPRTAEPDPQLNGEGNLRESGYVLVANPEGYAFREGDPGWSDKIVLSPGLDIKTGDPRYLQNYRPAESSDRTRYMVAPSYRVASKFGGMEYGGSPYLSAYYKCATYQEDGYPAGRWRLPTAAEIQFIASLQKQDFVTLFGSGNYWSANGRVTGGGSYTQAKEGDLALARCVYDSWYWDQFKDRLPREKRDTYYLGDLPQ